MEYTQLNRFHTKCMLSKGNYKLKYEQVEITLIGGGATYILLLYKIEKSTKIHLITQCDTLFYTDKVNYVSVVVRIIALHAHLEIFCQRCHASATTLYVKSRGETSIISYSSIWRLTSNAIT
jgi:hypothetical protein